MIGRLHGKLLEKNPPQVVIDVNGVGYEVDVSMNTFFALPEAGQDLRLFTHLAIREDGHFLYGFATQDERQAFRQLLKVSGIGARTALSILSSMTVADMADALAQNNMAPFIKTPGIGKKTAERLMLELRDKFLIFQSAAGSSKKPPSAADALINEVSNALQSLGYNDKEATHAVRQLPPGLALPEAIRHALKSLSNH